MMLWQIHIFIARDSIIKIEQDDISLTISTVIFSFLVQIKYCINLFIFSLEPHIQRKSCILRGAAKHNLNRWQCTRGLKAFDQRGALWGLWPNKGVCIGPGCHVEQGKDYWTASCCWGASDSVTSWQDFTASGLALCWGYYQSSSYHYQGEY